MRNPTSRDLELNALIVYGRGYFVQADHNAIRELRMSSLRFGPGQLKGTIRDVGPGRVELSMCVLWHLAHVFGLARSSL
jgi:hypothetical protein